MPVDQRDWKWFGVAAHFCCGQWCRFHMATQVGEYLISTVGEYVHPRHSNGSEAEEARWLSENWPGEDIGMDRKYETMVFRAGKPCTSAGCGCGVPEIGEVCDGFGSYNDRASAQAGHLCLCNEYAQKEESHE